MKTIHWELSSGNFIKGHGIFCFIDRSPEIHTANPAASCNPSQMNTQVSPSIPPLYFFCWDSLSTFFTIFCSSIKKARTMRSRTQLAHLDPPYARWTVFFGREIWEYSRGRSAGIYCVINVSIPLQEIVIRFKAPLLAFRTSRLLPSDQLENRQ